MAIQAPFNLNKWINENRDLLKPPVGNKNLYVSSGDYIVMVVAGPNARKDYHYNETEELFYQLEGTISIFVQDEGIKKEMKLSAGDMFLLPAKTPHSPVREANSVGLVVERKRIGQEIPDGLLWFCENCNHKLYEVYFELHDIEVDFLKHFNHFYNSKELRTCNKCKTILPTDERFVTKK